MEPWKNLYEVLTVFLSELNFLQDSTDTVWQDWQDQKDKVKLNKNLTYKQKCSAILRLAATFIDNT